MNALRPGLVRWLRFNLVGAFGFGAQLLALTLLNRVLPSHYLWASAIALELTLVHNLTWHWCYTWRERRRSTTLCRVFLRFHLSNGLVSFLGNLALLHFFVQRVHLPLLTSSVLAILVCSVANFFVSDSWVFHDCGQSSKACGLSASSAAAVSLSRSTSLP